MLFGHHQTPIDRDGHSPPASIARSSVSGATGSVIEQLGTDLTAPAAALGGIIKAASSLHPTLFAGTQYWLVLTPFDNLTDVG